jgi:hypothetical protein
MSGLGQPIACSASNRVIFFKQIRICVLTGVFQHHPGFMQHADNGHSDLTCCAAGQARLPSGCCYLKQEVEAGRSIRQSIEIIAPDSAAIQLHGHFWRTATVQ